MTKVFDTYRKKTTAYYISLLILIIPILFVVFTNAFSRFQFSEAYARYLDSTAVLGLIIYLGFRGYAKMYITDGDLKFTTDAIITNSFAIPLNEIEKIVINANDYKGKGRGGLLYDGSGNRIEIYDLSGKIYIYRFVIKSYVEHDNLKKILAHYTENGLIVTSNGF